MAEQTVAVRLVVAADGALRTLDKFDTGMSKAAAATIKQGSAADQLQAKLSRMRAAMEAGNPVLLERTQAISREQQAWDRLQAKTDAVTAARLKGEREIARSITVASNAYVTGLASQEQAIRSVMALESQHERQLEELTAAQMRSAGMGGPPGSNINSANIAAQFQDIAVSAQMGMSPLQVALQQGTQLSAALGSSGLKGTVTALGAAFASVLSPVSLLTIGVVGLGTFGIQALAGLVGGSDDATEALKRHDEWLDKVLAGYDDVRDAAKRATDEALRLPSQSAALEASGGAAAAQEAFDAQIKRLESFSRVIAIQEDTYPNLTGQFEQIRQLLDELEGGTLTVSRLDTALRNIKFSDTADDKVRDFVSDLLNAVEVTRSLEAALDGAAAAASGFSINGLIDATFSQLTGAADTIQQLKEMTPDLRTPAQRAQDLYDANSGSDANGDIKKQLDYTLGQIAEQERRQAALRSARSASKDFDQWGGSVESFQQRIASQQLEIDLVGKSTFEIEKQRAALELLNQAKHAGIAVTSDVSRQIDDMASQYANATAKLEEMTKAANDNAANMDFYKDTFRSFFTDMAHGLRQGEDAWSLLADAASGALDRIADRALGMAADGIFDMIFGAVSGALTGGIGGGFGGAGSFSIGKLAMYADGTDFAPGGLAMVGERGPELVNLPRGSQVFSNPETMRILSGGGGRPTLQVIVSGARGNAEISEMARAGAQQALDAYDATLPSRVDRLARRVNDDPAARNMHWA